MKKSWQYKLARQSGYIAGRIGQDRAAIDRYSAAMTGIAAPSIKADIGKDCARGYRNGFLAARAELRRAARMQALAGGTS